MSKKKRVAIICIAIFLSVVGLVCVGIAGNLQDTNKKYANIIGFSSFGLWILSLFLLLKNYPRMVSSKMGEIAEKMHSEAEFFSMISISETPQTLEERFIKAGYKLKQGYLHKRQFSFAKDYINYYVAIAQEERIIEYLEVFLKKAEVLFQNQSRFRKNNVIYLFFFNHDITREELDRIKTLIINQEVTQRLPVSFDAVLPIVYDTMNQKYIIRTRRSGLPIVLLNVALKKYYKMINLQ